MPVKTPVRREGSLEAVNAKKTRHLKEVLGVLIGYLSSSLAVFIVEQVALNRHVIIVLNAHPLKAGSNQNSRPIFLLSSAFLMRPACPLEIPGPVHRLFA